jgi:hypothetical protein
MAVTQKTVKTKITDRFTITAGEATYNVEEHTRYEVKNINDVKTEVLGRKYLLTDDGRGVIKNEIDNSYTIPSLGIKAVR